MRIKELHNGKIIQVDCMKRLNDNLKRTAILVWHDVSNGNLNALRLCEIPSTLIPGFFYTSISCAGCHLCNLKNVMINNRGISGYCLSPLNLYVVSPLALSLCLKVWGNRRISLFLHTLRSQILTMQWKLCLNSILWCIFSWDLNCYTVTKLINTVDSHIIELYFN